MEAVENLTTIYNLIERMLDYALLLLSDYKALSQTTILLLCQYVIALITIKSGIENTFAFYDNHDIKSKSYKIVKKTLAEASEIENDLRYLGITFEIH